jgi:hypothetical protein
MSKYILEGIIQKADDYKPNGRIYPKEAFNKVYKESVRKLIRKKKINKLFNE